MPYFTRERFGRPQFLAAGLLLCFLAQAVWLIHAEFKESPGLQSQEAARIGEGWKQWHGHGIAAAPFTEPAANVIREPFQAEEAGFDVEHSPLLYLLSAAPLLAWPLDLGPDSVSYWAWLPRLPFLACGLLLGASLWYVARRLCGNTGGFIALTLYCFSPALIQSSAASNAEPEIVSAWGAFGTIFTAIAVAHTLYAPREVVLWNWRRIVLLGTSIAIAVGAQFSMIIIVPLALGFLLYVAPVRRGAGALIWIAGCLVGFFLLCGFYFFHLHDFAQSVRHASFWGATWRGFTFLAVYKQVAIQMFRSCPVLALMLPVALVAYAAWPRTRYFGNTAPLIVAALFLLLGMAHPHVAGSGFLLASVPFLLIFVSGVLADLLETSYRPLIQACVVALLITDVILTMLGLARLPQS